MAIDLEAIRRKIAQVNGQKKQLSSVQLWKPEPGEHKIRALPWKDALEGSPFLERSFYAIGQNKMFLAPSQFGNEDAIEKLRISLFASKKPDEKAMAKTLFPKVYAYLPIIDRSDSSMQIQIWKFSKMLNSRLLGFFLDEDCGDFLDVIDGNDLKVVVKQIPGKMYSDMAVDFRPKKTPLHEDAEVRAKLLAAIPNLDDLHPYAFKTATQIDSMVSAWLSGDSATEGDNLGSGQTKASNNLESLVDEISTKPAKAKPAKKETKPVVDEDDDADVTPKTSSNLDDAFAELMAD